MPVSYLAIVLGFAAGVLVGCFLGFALSTRKRKVKASPPRSASNRTINVTAKTQVIRKPAYEPEMAAPVLFVDSEDNVVRLRQNLLLKALGSKSVVDRLVEFERKKNPTGDQVQWLEAAIRQWEHDNHR
jgi:hypothetical protein